MGHTVIESRKMAQDQNIMHWAAVKGLSLQMIHHEEYYRRNQEKWSKTKHLQYERDTVIKSGGLENYLVKKISTQRQRISFIPPSAYLLATRNVSQPYCCMSQVSCDET